MWTQNVYTFACKAHLRKEMEQEIELEWETRTQLF